jgi:hypothetical protein
MDSQELPRCYFCDRYAFEFDYEGLCVCEECMTNMSRNKVWHLIRTLSGEYFVTSFTDLKDFEVVSEGTFKEMWDLCQRTDTDGKH